jgi:Uma2 family endonuclease
MILAIKKVVTLEEFLILPETKPYSEYIDGEIIQKPMPQGKHSRLQGKLVPGINTILEVQRLAIAFPELRCTFGGRSTVPDVTVFEWHRIPVDVKGNIENVFSIPPDWTIEILSPEQSQTKVTSNILHCLKHGSQMGWLIAPEDESVIVYAGQNADQRKLPSNQISVEIFEAFDDVLPVPSFAKDLRLTVGDLFGWLKL